MTSAKGRRLTLPAAAEYLGVTVAELEGMVRRGQIAFHRISFRGRRYFYVAELDQHIESTRVDAIAPTPRKRYGRDVSHLIPSGCDVHS